MKGIPSLLLPLNPLVLGRADWHHMPVGLSVLIVDDHSTFRSFARDLLESEGFEVIGEAEDGSSGIEAATALQPKIVLLDVQLPDITGFEVTRGLIAAGVTAAVVLVSSRDASDYGDEIESSGASGFVPKAELSGAAIRAILSKGTAVEAP